MKKRLIIVDISSFIFRAFFAIRPMSAPDGTPVNSLYGTLSMVLKLLNTYNPTHIILARDLAGGSFRNEIYPEYKANRGAPPEELIPQFALIDELFTQMQIPQKAMETYEADDIIGALATQFKNDFDEIYIASGDKDLMQFVDDKVKMLDTMKEKLYGPKEVYEKMGVHPNQIMDYLSLLGDSSDNIPGVKGIGAKGAAKLLEEYENLDKLIENIEHISNKRAKTALEGNIEMAHLSRKLVEIKTDMDLGLKPDDLKFELTPHEGLMQFLDKVNFKSMKAKIASNEPTAVSAKPENFISFDFLSEKKKIDEVLSEIPNYDQVFLEPIYNSDNYHDGIAQYCGVAYGENVKIIDCEAIDGLEGLLSPILDSDTMIIGTDTRALAFAAQKLGREMQNAFDLTQAHFVIDADKKHNLESMAQEYLYETIISLKDLKKESMESEQSKRNFQFALAKRSWAGLRVYPWLDKALKENNLYQIYFDLDMKLIPILSQMEAQGIDLDVKFYSKLEKEFTEQTDEIEKQIFEAAGEEVNLKSPKQVSKLLFETLELPIVKKTKTGASTDSSVLEYLDATEDSEIPGLILQYREIEKLNSTYVKSFPKLVGDDGKIHTHFLQNVAATGRLSSESPNLQNIPIRTENGRRLRQGFQAEKGYQLLGADYSQVELRILAHFSEDPVMVKAFENNEDIHAQTAAEVFGMNLSDVTREERSTAKAINFGLMYGQSSFGLSQQLGISRTEAKDYITQYFKKFKRVKSFLDGLKEECEKKGYSETLFGRRRYIKDINSTNRQVKSMAERMAINSPIQGTAADIIKLAMINIDHELKEQGLKSRLLLQVHDELIFEVPENELDLMQSLVREKMELAALLKVPLKVDMGHANNWYDLK
tara:strand:+ start:64091 stop:66727 length:2637 start_codon:yes stop_codon:yes gene_type:complete